MALPEPRPPDAGPPFLVTPLGVLRESPTTTPAIGGVSPVLEPETESRKGCPNNGTFWLYSPSLDSRVPRPCKSWSCPTCGRVKREAARELFTVGTERVLEEYGRVRVLTLTAPGRGRMTLEDTARGWNRVMASLRRKRPDGSRAVESYAGVVEFQKRGAPHIHALLAGPEFLPVERLRSLAVGRKGSRGRFGPRIGIEAVGREDAEAVAGYLTKFEETATTLAGYLTKGKVEGWHRDGRTRVRPVWSSRGWYPGGLTAAEEAVKVRWNKGEPLPSPGDWRLERVDPDTGVLTDLGPLRGGTVHPLPLASLRAA